MSDSLSEAELVAQAEALVDEVFSHLTEPSPCLPPAGSSTALARPIAEPGTMVVLAYDPAPLLAQPPHNPERILTAAFVEDRPAERSTPWWVWLGLGVLVMLATWYGRQQWQAARTPAPAEPAHQEFIAYLERALADIPVAPSPAVTMPQTPTRPAAVTALPPPPPVTVMPVPQAPVIHAPTPLPTRPVRTPAVNKSPDPAPAPLKVTLIGFLEMGVGSVALFQMGDITQQVSVGSQVGQSGWYLKEVRAQEVVIHRGGQTRTLLVGQGITD
jgi:hypothetical protein